MSLTLYQQAKQLIEKSEKILLVAHAKMDGDTLSATIAMHLLLKKLNKITVVACADPVPEEFSFLPETEVMQKEVSSAKDFVISVDCSRVQAQKLRWKIDGNILKIFITPTDGQFQERDVSFLEHEDFDLIISLDAADRKQIGRIFEENTELFTRLPLIVFDHHASNPGFGTVNIIDSKAASTTEVLFHFLPTLLGEQWASLVDPDIATLLLTGIITDTGSFQNPNTTPKSLEVAADLVELGARQQEIIRNIFKTKNIQTLKLWGRVLSKIKTDPVHRLLWSTVTTDDLLDTGASVEDTGGIIDELLATAPGMEMVILLKERPDGIIQGSIRSITPLCNSAEFSAEFGGGGHTQAAGFKITGDKPFDVVVGEVISAARTFQDRRLKLSEHRKNTEEEKKTHGKNRMPISSPQEGEAEIGPVRLVPSPKSITPSPKVDTEEMAPTPPPSSKETPQKTTVPEPDFQEEHFSGLLEKIIQSSPEKHFSTPPTSSENTKDEKKKSS